MYSSCNFSQNICFKLFSKPINLSDKELIMNCSCVFSKIICFKLFSKSINLSDKE
jgi:hypothetical protein